MRNKGYRVREVDSSEIPEHILKNLKRLQPNESDCLDGLTSDDWETASSSDNGSVWVLQCPADVNLSDLISGKKLSLDGKRLLLKDGGDDENVETGSSTIRHRMFETVSVSRRDFKEGVVLLLPENNNFKLVSAPVQGHIIIRESLKQLEVPKLQVPPPIPRELPLGIKERHPVYGSDFTDILKEMEESPVKKKKKKKSHKPEPESEPPQFTRLTLSFNDTQNFNTDNEFTSPADKDKIKKKKKKKREHDDGEPYSLEKSNDISDLSSFDDEVRVKKEKKSKKRKREEMEQFETSEQDLLTNDDVRSTRKSKKSKH